MVTGFEAWRYYLAIKLHFTSKDYDAIKSAGHITGGQSAYTKRRDKDLFERLASKFEQPREIIKYLVANFAYGHNSVIYDREQGQENLLKWIKNKESLSRIFSNDLDVISDYFSKHNILLSQMFNNCIILKLCNSKLINIETLCLLSQYNPTALDTLSNLPECKLIYTTELLRIKKMSSFLVKNENCDKVWNEFKKE